MSSYNASLLRLLTDSMVHTFLHENLSENETVIDDDAKALLDRMEIDLSLAWECQQDSVLTYPTGLEIGRPTSSEGKWEPPFLDTDALARGCYIWICWPYFCPGWVRIC